MLKKYLIMKFLTKLSFFLTILIIANTLQAQEVNHLITGQLIIKMKDSAKAQKSTLRSQMHATILKSYPDLGIEHWEVQNAKDLQETLKLINQLKNHPEVEYVEPNYIWKAIDGTIPNDPDFDKLWGLHNTGQTGGKQDADIDASEAYCLPVSASKVVVGVIDSGIDYTHEDLAENIWQNLAEDADGDGKVLIRSGDIWIFDPDDENGIDDDGNGYIDDFVGWDFTTNSNDPMDFNSHGTHCAGTIGAISNNNIGITGAAPNVKLAALKFLNKEGNGYTSDAIEALEYALKMEIPITNNSWGGGHYSSALSDVLQEAEANNHIFVAAAGNGGSDYIGDDNDLYPHYPSSYEHNNIITVGSTDRNDNRSSFSNYGATSVDIAAPGSRIYSCIPGNSYGNKSGTSMACPHVAGVCAFMMGLNPGNSFNAIKNAVLTSIDPLPDLNGKCASGGRVNLYNALVEMGAPSNPCDETLPKTCNRTTDSLALMALYNSTDGSSWTNKWDLNKPIDSWYGIALNTIGCVTHIDLDGEVDWGWSDSNGNNLIGTIPVQLSNLNYLQHLILANNQLAGVIPSQLGNLSDLWSLDLHSNQLTGSIPSEIGNLNRLRYLILYDNKLSSYIPSQLANLGNLLHLDLSNNPLGGSIPSELGNLNKLEYIDLRHCNLIYSIPSELGNLHYLTDLIIGYNQFDGSIPAELGNLINLKTLYLNDNQLTGSIPFEIGKLQNLRHLWLGNNKLSNEIPSELGDLTNLEHLYLCNNNLSGCYGSNLKNLCSKLTIPIWDTNSCISEDNNFETAWGDFCANDVGSCGPQICDQLSDRNALIALYNSTNGANWTNRWDLNKPIDTWYGVQLNEKGCVSKLKLLDNNLTGNIPSELGNLNNLEGLFMHGNRLSGNIPIELGNLVHLISLGLSSNQLEGSIPEELGNLTNLKKLGLHVNQLNGNIPPQLGNISNLEILYLFRNELVGNIPPELGNLINLSELHFSYNELVGGIPASLGNLINLSELHLSRNKLTGSIPTELGDLNNLTQLDLAVNQLRGSIPVELGNLNKLTNMFLSENDLIGGIPSSMGELSNLEELNLCCNKLSGNIPPELSSLSNLNYLSLSSNQLSGSIPDNVSNLTSLADLHLASNKLSGSIPAGLGNLSNLNYLLLSYNELIGCYPTNLSNLCNQLTNSGNINISNGNNFNDSWEDFCNNKVDACGPSNSQVWPGDFDNNGTVEINDLLYWGIAYNASGFSRPNSSINWVGQASEDWDNEVNGLNSKHQDGDGNGVVDEQDLFALIQNLGQNYSFTLPNSLSSNMKFNLIPDYSYNSTTDNESLAYDFYLEDTNPTLAHGISASIYFGNLNIENVSIDTVGSVLSPQEYLVDFDKKRNTLNFSITKTNGNNSVLDGPLCRVIVGIIEAETGESFAIDINSGGIMQANGTMHEVSGTTVYGESHGNRINDINSLRLNASVSHADCGANGTAFVNALGSSGNYSYEWNTGATTQQITNLSPGIYSVTVSDDNGVSSSIEVEVQGQFIPIYDKNGDIIPCDAIQNSSNLIICPETREVNICAPVSPPPSLKIEDFERVDSANLFSELFLEVETLTDVQQYFTTTTYLYTISDGAGNQQTCQTQYHIANQFLQAPEVSDPGYICEEELWSFIKIGAEKYKIYKDNNGSAGKELSTCETPRLICSTAEFEVDTDIPATYHFWATKFIQFPNGEICEGPEAPFNVEIKPKPVASLSTLNKTVNIQEVVILSDLVTDDKSGYWTGENIVSVPTPNGEFISIFSSNTAGNYKLYYTVKNDYCERSYLLVVNVVNGIMKPNTGLSGLNEKPYWESESVNSDNQFRMYPNPSTGKKLIVIPRNTKNKGEQHTIKIFDLIGNIIIQKQFTDRAVELNLNTFKKGVYIVELRSAGNQSIQKLLVE